MSRRRRRGDGGNGTAPLFAASGPRRDAPAWGGPRLETAAACRLLGRYGPLLVVGSLVPTSVILIVDLEARRGCVTRGNAPEIRTALTRLAEAAREKVEQARRDSGTGRPRWRLSVETAVGQGRATAALVMIRYSDEPGGADVLDAERAMRDAACAFESVAGLVSGWAMFFATAKEALGAGR